MGLCIETQESGVSVLPRMESNGHRVKSLCTDNGGEYTSLEFESYLKKEGITRVHRTKITGAERCG